MLFVVSLAILAWLLLEAVCGQTIWFEPNQGQVHRSVEFLARSSAGYVYFARNRMAVRDLRMELVGGRRKASAEFAEPAGGISSYFIGRTEKDWHTGVPHYSRVRYRNVYSGIDLVYYGSGRGQHPTRLTEAQTDFAMKPEVPCSSSYGGIMCQVQGYEVNVPTGSIAMRLTARDIKARWQSHMAWTFHIPDPPEYRSAQKQE